MCALFKGTILCFALDDEVKLDEEELERLEVLKFDFLVCLD